MKIILDSFKVTLLITAKKLKQLKSLSIDGWLLSLAWNINKKRIKTTAKGAIVACTSWQ